MVYVPRPYKSAEYSLLKPEYQNRRVHNAKKEPQASSSFLNKPNSTSGVIVELIGYDNQPDTQSFITEQSKCDDSEPTVENSRLSESSSQSSECEKPEGQAKLSTSSTILDDVLAMELEYEQCHPNKEAVVPEDLTEVDVGELYCPFSNSNEMTEYLE